MVRQHTVKGVRWLEILVCLVVLPALSVRGDVLFFEDFTSDSYKTRPEYAGYTDKNSGYSVMEEDYAGVAGGSGFII